MSSEAEYRLKIFQEFRDYVKHEDGLRVNRTNTLLTSQSLLFAAEGVLIAKSPPSHLSTSAQIIIAIVGVATSWIGYSRLNDQKKVMDNIDDIYEAYGTIKELPSLRFANLDRKNVKSYVIDYPSVFMLAWFSFIILAIGFRMIGVD